MDNKITYEEIIKFNRNKFDTRITIRDKFIILEKKKGLFKKKYINIDLIHIDDIVVSKNNIHVTVSKEEVEIETKNKKYSFIFKNVIAAKRFNDEIIKLKEKPGKLSKTINVLGTVISLVGTAATVISKNKKYILDTAEMIKEIIKNKE